ncbi:MAG TPA: peptidylprolyl isomerase [Dermatophilaceae bacterium]|nr:peptidylprolyl isomerase [Dermatophilaceae bacterium]
MSPKDRDRAYEKRRYEKRQSMLDQRIAERQRNKQVVGVVVAVLLVVGGLVGLSVALGNDDGTASTGASPSTPATAPTSTAPTPTGSTSPTASAAQTVAGCRPAPKPPTDKRTATLPPATLAGGKTWVATMTTNCGDIVVDLDGAKAPQAVSSFINLARTGYWVDSPCHRLTGQAQGLYVLQCGDPTGTGTGGPGYGFGVENAPADFTYPPGTLAMARTSDPKSNGGQFFIVYQQTVLQDPTGYTIFGKVTKGLDLVKKIAAAGISAADQTAPNQPISLLKVVVAEKKG